MAKPKIKLKLGVKQAIKQDTTCWEAAQSVKGSLHKIGSGSRVHNCAAKIPNTKWHFVGFRRFQAKCRQNIQPAIDIIVEVHYN